MELLMWPTTGSSAPDAVMTFSDTKEPESSITSALTPPSFPHTVAAFFDLVVATVTTLQWRLTGGWGRLLPLTGTPWPFPC